MLGIIEKIQELLPEKKINIFGKEQLMKYTFPYYLLSLIMLLAIFGPIQNGYMFIFIIYSVLPLLDEIFNLDLRNPTESERKYLEERDPYFKLALYCSMFLDWVLFFKSMNLFATMELTPINIFNLVGFLFIFSNLNAVQFAIAHQIFHKPGKFYKYLGTIHMIKNLYMHFTYQHLYGHHRKVATPQDPASAEKGISLYQFVPRSFIGSYKSVYNMQKQEGKSFFQNYLVLSVIASLLFTALMFKFYGIQGGIIFLIEAFGSIFYLQAINYLEHYGLRRKKLSDGSYEKVTIRHSWNAPHRFTNYLLFKLQRHSDHHQNSVKPYQTLISLEDSPHLPHGYSVAIFMSFFPSVWFKIMDPLVDQYSNLQTGNTNGHVMQESIKQTRKFIIECTLATGFLFLFTTLM